MNHPIHIKRVLIVSKQSTYQRYILDDSRGKVAKLYKQRHESTDGLLLAHKQHSRTLDIVTDYFKKKNISYKVISTRKLPSLKAFDFILTVGGDGTFLRVSHEVEDQLVMGVNSARSMSVGALCSCSEEDFRDKMASILSGNYKVRQLNRLEIQINQKTLPMKALNDVLFANQCPAGTARYVIKIGGTQEDQKSSGIWISTGAGSTGAISAAGGRAMSPTSQKIQYRVREPFVASGKVFKLTKGIIRPGHSIKLIIKTFRATLYIDGTQGFVRVKFGDEILFHNANQPLNVVI